MKQFLFQHLDTCLEPECSLEDLNIHKILEKRDIKIKSHWKRLLDNGYIVYLNCELDNNVNATYKTISLTKNNLQFLREQLTITITNPDGTNKTINFDHRTITAYDENGHRKAYVLDAHDRTTNVLEYNNDPVLKFNYEAYVYNTSYEYDTADNLVKITDTLGNQFTFTYDSLGRRIALTDPDLGNWTYTYDLVGNLITQKQQGGGNLVTGDGYYREYDGLNQLIKIRNGSSATSPQLENYTYDPFGQRIKIMRNDSAKTIIYTPFKEFMRIKNTTGIYNFTYIYQDGVLVARVNPDGTKYFYHPDHLGSTTLITNSSGNVVENTYYSPYGEILGGGSKDVKLYTGQMKDFPCQYYYGKRYFAPCLGIFIQPDTIIKNMYNPQNLNRYSYVLNNPYKYIDYSGLWAIQLGASFSGVLGIAGGTAGRGLVISYNNRQGFQLGSYTIGGGGIAGGGGVTITGDISFTPDAQSIKDIEGWSESAGFKFAGGLAIGFEYSRPSDNKKSSLTHTWHFGGGYQAEAHTFVTYTKVVDIRDTDNYFSDSYSQILNQLMLKYLETLEKSKENKYSSGYSWNKIQRQNIFYTPFDNPYTSNNVCTYVHHR